MTDPVTTLNIPDRVGGVVAAALDRKAIDVRVLRLETVCAFTDYFIICSGSSSRQVGAIADNVSGSLRDRRVKPLHIEGKRRGCWVLMDYGDFIVHVFDLEQRERYRLEDMWSDAADETEIFVPAQTVQTPDSAG